MASNTNPKPRDVLELLDNIPRQRPRDVTVVGNPGTEIIRSHVQGIAAFRDGYLLTHSNVEGDAGRLLVVDGKRNATSVVLPDFVLAGARLNHPGGCQAIGDYLVIPFEAVDKNVSRVSVFDVSHPLTPVELTTPAPIERLDRKAGAAGIANVTIDGREHWFLGIYDNGRVDMFRTDGAVFPDSDFSFQFTHTIPDGYESFCLIAEASNRLFAVGFRLDSRRRDKADLYAVHLDTERLELLESWRYVPHILQTVRFRWGAGVDIRPDGTVAVLCTGRNFLALPFGEIERPEGGLAAELHEPLEKGVVLAPHCHIDIFAPA